MQKEQLEAAFAEAQDACSADFVHDIERLTGSAFLLGKLHAAEENPAHTINAADDSTDIPPVAFSEAVDFLKGKVPLTKAEWSALEPKLRFRAFTVARLGEATLIESAKQQLIAALEDGTGYRETWERLKSFADTDALGIKAGYWENVFRTNTQSAYVAGKLQQYEGTGAVAYQLFVVEDSRTSRFCRALLTSGRGLILPVGHSFWKRHGFPPYHFQCRTSIRAVYASQVGKDGLNVDNPAMSELRGFKPMDGFGGNPLEKESWWKMTDKMIENAEKFGVWADILQQAYDMDMRSYQKELLKGYEPIYKGAHGGYVHQAKNWEFSQKEMDAAQKLADGGHQVYLLPRNGLTKHIKSPDCLIDDEIGEFKHQEILTKGAIENEIKKAKIQRARIVYLKALDGMKKMEIAEALKSEVLRSPIKIVYLEWQGKITALTRKAIRLKTW